jgi:lipoprotein signal peptidase
MSTLYSDIKAVYELLWGKGYLQTLPFIFMFDCIWHWRAFEQNGFAFGLRSTFSGFAGYLFCMICVLVFGLLSWRTSTSKQMTTLGLTK